jgi:hypothetical protein
VAEEKKKETIVVEKPVPTLSEVLKKFSGNLTPRTLNAASRIRAKKHSFKVPNKVTQIAHGYIGREYSKPSDSKQMPESERAEKKSIKTGDLEIQFWYKKERNENVDRSTIYILCLFRTAPFLYCYYSTSSWNNNDAKVRRALASYNQIAQPITETPVS